LLQKNKSIQRTLVIRNNLIFARLEYEVFYKSIVAFSFSRIDKFYNMPCFTDFAKSTKR